MAVAALDRFVARSAAVYALLTQDAKLSMASTRKAEMIFI